MRQKRFRINGIGPCGVVMLGERSEFPPREMDQERAHDHVLELDRFHVGPNEALQGGRGDVGGVIARDDLVDFTHRTEVARVGERVVT